MRRVYRTFISELVGDRAALIVRGHTDPILDTWPDAATLRAFLEKASTKKISICSPNEDFGGRDAPLSDTFQSAFKRGK